MQRAPSSELPSALKVVRNGDYGNLPTFWAGQVELSVEPFAWIDRVSKGCGFRYSALNTAFCTTPVTAPVSDVEANATSTARPVPGMPGSAGLLGTGRPSDLKVVSSAGAVGWHSAFKVWAVPGASIAKAVARRESDSAFFHEHPLSSGWLS